MAGAMRKMAVYLGLVEDEADLYDDYDLRRGRDHAPRRPRPSRAPRPGRCSRFATRSSRLP